MAQVLGLVRQRTPGRLELMRAERGQLPEQLPTPESV